MYTSYWTLKILCSLLSNCSSSEQWSHHALPQTWMSGCLPWVPLYVQSPKTLNSTHTQSYPLPISAPCWHWLTIYLFLARRLVSLSAVTGVLQLSKWCKNRLKTECNLNCWTSLHQFFPFQHSLDICYGINYPREGHWQSGSAFTQAFLRDLWRKVISYYAESCVEY